MKLDLAGVHAGSDFDPQTACSLADGVPEPGRVELVVAHPNGIVEIAEGTLEGTTMRLRSTVVGRTSSAKDVTVIERDWALDGGVLGYALRMTAVGQRLTHHLAAKLHRVD